MTSFFLFLRYEGKIKKFSDVLVKVGVFGEVAIGSIKYYRRN
jgi:hypothetical protein